MRHPLDPLDGPEISAAAEIVRKHGKLSAKAWFETIALEEPSKQQLAAGRTRRIAYVCCYDPANNQTWAGQADLEAGTLLSWRHQKGMQARIGIDEFIMGGDVAKADSRFIAACAKRGITDMSTVLVEPWAAGNFGIKNEEGKRMAVGHCWVRNALGDNPYARPIANLHPIIDLQHMQVLRVDDFGAEPLPPECTPIKASAFRDDLKPLTISQSEGPSFKVEGQLVKWQKWCIRIGFHPRDGLVLHTIGYEDNGRIRPIMHRASLSEMVVPYGDPRGNYYRRNAFDTGEYGIGQLTDSLVLGCDCLGHIHYFDAWRHDWNGNPLPIKNAICMHEEDFGTLWKFTNTYQFDVTVKRSRRLVISSVATIGNYVYGFFWYFYQDGTIGVEVKATGIPLGQSHKVGRPPAYGAEVAPGIDAPVHQHVFSYRFDMTVDGDHNSIAEVNFSKIAKGPRNRPGNAIAIKEKQLSREKDAQRNISLEKARYWKVFNSEAKNAMGHPTAYKLVPGTNALPFLHKSSQVAKRAGFMFRHFWASQFAADELYAAGKFPNQHRGGDGLPKWTRKNRSLKQKNVVVWYTMNYHHLPRPEDWPVQPCVYANFHWMPVGFFDANPALDVPSPQAGACCD
jgi:primary-amine oxidase